MFDFLNLPKQSEIGDKIDKKMFYENSDLNATERRWLKDNVEKIVWCNRISYDTVNIRGYCDEKIDYTEIQVINVQMRTDVHVRATADVLFSSFPYPLILIFTYRQDIMFFVASVRINQNDKSRLTVEEVVQTKWFLVESDVLMSLDVTKIIASDLFQLYSGFTDSLLRLKVELEVGPGIEVDAVTSRSILEQVKEIDDEITSMKARLKAEDHFNRLVAISDEIKKLEKQRQELLDSVKNSE